MARYLFWWLYSLRHGPMGMSKQEVSGADVSIPLWKFAGLMLTGPLLLLAGAMPFVQWTVDNTLSGIDKRIEGLADEVNQLEINLARHVERLDSTVAQAGGKVNAVDSTIEIAGVESVQVKDDVDEVKLKVEAISSGLDDTSGKIDSLKTVLNVAFRHDADIRVLLEDDRLSELLPVEFFEEEPTVGAARPAAELSGGSSGGDSSQPVGAVRSNRDSIANRCSDQGTATTSCYGRYIKRYEVYRGNSAK